MSRRCLVVDASQRADCRELQCHPFCMPQVIYLLEETYIHVNGFDDFIANICLLFSRLLKTCELRRSRKWVTFALLHPPYASLPRRMRLIWTTRMATLRVKTEDFNETQTQTQATMMTTSALMTSLLRGGTGKNVRFLSNPTFTIEMIALVAMAIALIERGRGAVTLLSIHLKIDNLVQAVIARRSTPMPCPSYFMRVKEDSFLRYICINCGILY